MPCHLQKYKHQLRHGQKKYKANVCVREQWQRSSWAVCTRPGFGLQLPPSKGDGSTVALLSSGRSPDLGVKCAQFSRQRHNSSYIMSPSASAHPSYSWKMSVHDHAQSLRGLIVLHWPFFSYLPLINYCNRGRIAHQNYVDVRNVVCFVGKLQYDHESVSFPMLILSGR